MYLLFYMCISFICLSLLSAISISLTGKGDKIYDSLTQPFRRSGAAANSSLPDPGAATQRSSSPSAGIYQPAGHLNNKGDLVGLPSYHLILPHKRTPSRRKGYGNFFYIFNRVIEEKEKGNAT